MIKTLIMLGLVCLFATLMILDFILVIPKFGSKHFGAPDDIKEMMEKKPEEVVAHAVSGMLPKNKLRDRMMTRLRVYRGAEHPHAAQNPQVLNV